jgi:hypothetical protein
VYREVAAYFLELEKVRRGRRRRMRWYKSNYFRQRRERVSLSYQLLTLNFLPYRRQAER